MSLFNYECDEVKRKIEEVSPNYPQLTTYEKEWLYFHKYGYIPGIPVELEYETVSVNPTGSVSNAIPFRYKSAILKGNTKYRDIDTGDILDTFDETKNLELVSVKMPVLTTIGKNLCPDILPINTSNPSIIYNIKVQKDKIYTISSNMNYSSLNRVRFTVYENYDSNVRKNVTDYIEVIDGLYMTTDRLFISNHQDLNYGAGTFRVKNDCYIRLHLRNQNEPNLEFRFQLEESSTNTSYEPYKSNILTVNEEVELRGIGDVKDELDLVTGELTQRIGEVVLDGSEKWAKNGSLTNMFRAYCLRETYLPNAKGSQGGIADVFPTYSYNYDVLNNDETKGLVHAINELYIKVPKSDLPSEDIAGLKQWLSQNPITVQYQLATESIKTVALTPLNTPYEGVNHYHLTSNIPCESILEVPVISTGEQTLQEINNY